MTSFQQFIDKMLYIEFTKPDTWLITLILDYYPEHVNDVFLLLGNVTVACQQQIFVNSILIDK